MNRLEMLLAAIRHEQNSASLAAQGAYDAAIKERVTALELREKSAAILNSMPPGRATHFQATRRVNGIFANRGYRRLHETYQGYGRAEVHAPQFEQALASLYDTKVEHVYGRVNSPDL